MTQKKDEVGDFLGAYPPGVRELALSLRSTSGTRHKHVQFSKPSDLRQAGVKPLIKASRSAWQARRGE